MNKAALMLKVSAVAVALCAATVPGLADQGVPKGGLSNAAEQIAPSALVSAASSAPTLSAVDRENIELRIEARVREQTSNQFAVIISVAVGLLGILITVVLVFFAIKTKDAAVAEAARGIEEVRVHGDEVVKKIHTEYEIVKNEFESLMAGIKASSDKVRHLEKQTESFAADVAQRLASKEELTSIEQLTLDVRSSIAGRKTADVYSTEDYLLLIAKEIENKEWSIVRNLATAMREHAETAEMRAVAYFYEGTALFQLRHIQEAVDLLGEAVALFVDSDDLGVRRQVAKINNNRIVALNNAERHEEALALIPDALNYLKCLPEEKAKDLRWKLKINEGNALSHLDRNEDAIATYRQVIAEIESNEPTIHSDRLSHAYFNLACAYSLMRKVKEAVAGLEKSRSIAITLNTMDIAADPDFAPIRNTLTFKRFLKRHGLD